LLAILTQGIFFNYILKYCQLYVPEEDDIISATEGKNSTNVTFCWFL